MKPDPRKLSQERLDEIRALLVGAGHAQAAEELAGHVEALEDEVTMISQYYEEFLIPQMEGRPIGRWSACGLSRKADRQR
jgi:hypothetical protein